MSSTQRMVAQSLSQCLTSSHLKLISAYEKAKKGYKLCEKFFKVETTWSYFKFEYDISAGQASLHIHFLL